MPSGMAAKAADTQAAPQRPPQQVWRVVGCVGSESAAATNAPDVSGQRQQHAMHARQQQHRQMSASKQQQFQPGPSPGDPLCEPPTVFGLQCEGDAPPNSKVVFAGVTLGSITDSAGAPCGPQQDDMCSCKTALPLLARCGFSSAESEARCCCRQTRP